MTTRLRGRAVRLRTTELDPVIDADEIARLSLVTLHGHGVLVYALFTVAFMKQVAVPAMARTLYRRGTGDIVQHALQRNDDTIVFFGQLLDHGPDSPVGRQRIDRLNAIHAHFPMRNDDSLYTLATLALDPDALTSDLAATLFTEAELEAHWRFWRAVAARQHITGIPETRGQLAQWAEQYERQEYAHSIDGRAIADALIAAFGQRCLPAPLRRWDRHVISTLCPPPLREVHALPEPSPAIAWSVRVLLRAYRASLARRAVPVARSLAHDFHDTRYGPRPIEEVGYQRVTGKPAVAELTFENECDSE